MPRVTDPASAAHAALKVTRWADESDLDGVLLFTGAGAVLDPWVGATAIAAASQRLVPMVAINPLYTHPFAAARSMLSIAELYQRQVDLNLITGAAVSELPAVCDGLDHREQGPVAPAPASQRLGGADSPHARGRATSARLTRPSFTFWAGPGNQDITRTPARHRASCFTPAQSRKPALRS
ncbi:LLM class flavin-dependent oxidoreductase [Amycolatopsis carbonis]|uniref:LLM class flavin-dependent oxidoreductase n=1 Tax=Amycolatopsis carbonis TaxID=715471 RepID=A0A9Y2IBZ5_9PSEU|nr:LLM class flavin-dependent oxidoreductase [Amycolatopsis sp. 2-15]WIX75693.1 LLM class flavin-dependent oxidoreductase [Amycolatopsis sp. 2-15]